MPVVNALIVARLCGHKCAIHCLPVDRSILDNATSLAYSAARMSRITATVGKIDVSTVGAAVRVAGVCIALSVNIISVNDGNRPLLRK